MMAPVIQLVFLIVQPYQKSASGTQLFAFFRKKCQNLDHTLNMTSLFDIEI